MLKLITSPTLKVVGAVMAALSIAGCFYFFGALWGVILSLMLGFEFYTLINEFPNDTISEVVVSESKKRPYLIMFICAPIFFAAGKGWLGDPNAVMVGIIIGAILGHWFWRLFLKDELKSGS